MKVKKSVKILLIIGVFLAAYLTSKFILFNEYNKYKEKVVHLTKNGIVLDDKIFYEIRTSKSIFLNNNLYIGNNFDSIIKEDESWKVFDNGLNYSFKVKEENKDDYKMYKEMISNINSISMEKLSFISSVKRLNKSKKIAKNIYKHLPQYNEIFIVDGKKKHGYIYKYNNEINAVIFLEDKKYHVIFEGQTLEYDYVVKMLSTLSIDQ